MIQLAALLINPKGHNEQMILKRCLSVLSETMVNTMKSLFALAIMESGCG